MAGKVTSLSSEAYAALLERLEVSVLKLSELEFTMRTDAEYYRKKFIHMEELIESKSYTFLGRIGKFKIGPFGSAFKVENYVKNKSYRYIRGKDVKPLELKDDDSVYMPKADFLRLKSYALSENDVLVSVVGTLGNAAIVNKETLPAIFSCKSTAIRTTNTNPFYLLVYLNSYYGRELLLRKERGAIQKGLNLDDLKHLHFYTPHIEFQQHIETLIKKSYQLKQTAQTLYTTAEARLLAALGLSDYTPSTENVQVKSFKDSFLTSERLDAEYYQPKYEEIEQKLKGYVGGWDCLGNQIESIDTGEYSKHYLNKTDGLKFFIRNTNINNGFLEEATSHYVNPDGFTKFVRTGDILTARVGAIGTFGTVTEAFDGSVFSDNVLRLKFPDNFSPEIYTMYFNALPNQELMEKIAGGSVQPLVTQTTMKNLIIPLFEQTIQTQISQAIRRSFALKTQSKQLLHIAKTGVERAIESSEAAAMEWMQQQVAALVQDA